jgi:hypothetical protein
MTTYAKLKRGDWGLRGQGLTSGARVSVTRKDGQVKTEIVGRILWTGEDGLQLATITRETESHGRTGRPCGYPGCTGRNVCDQCTE